MVLFIKKFNSAFLNVYTECFNDKQWLEDYGYNVSTFDFNEYISKAVLTEYQDVIRLIVLNKSKQGVGFAHVCFDGKECLLLGGILPVYRNSGLGIYSAVVVYDYIFAFQSISAINITILEPNKNSLRMHNKIGFTVKGYRYQDNGKLLELKITKSEFENTFNKIILSKISYEVL